jgi:hypothetical protein
MRYSGEEWTPADIWDKQSAKYYLTVIVGIVFGDENVRIEIKY